jgi:hypothetical protein
VGAKAHVADVRIIHQTRAQGRPERLLGQGRNNQIADSVARFGAPVVADFQILKPRQRLQAKIAQIDRPAGFHAEIGEIASIRTSVGRIIKPVSKKVRNHLSSIC